MNITMKRKNLSTTKSMAKNTGMRGKKQKMWSVQRRRGRGRRCGLRSRMRSRRASCNGGLNRS